MGIIIFCVVTYVVLDTIGAIAIIGNFLFGDDTNY